MSAFQRIDLVGKRILKSLSSPRRKRGGHTTARALRSEKLEPRQMMTGSTASGAYGVMVTGDFNDDGYDDVAMGLADQNINGNDRAGAVAIHYGSAGGLLSNNGVFHQDSPGISGLAEEGDRFGAALSVGDFNGDGFDDLAIGAPNENFNGKNAGAVHILYGSFNGLTGSGSRLLTGSPGARLGTVLETGNFNGDRNTSTGLPIDDLAIGLPFADLGVDSGLPNTGLDGNYVDAGAVYIYHGSLNGIGPARTRSISQEGSIVGKPEDGDFFGFSLAAGDFNNDGRDDLAIGLPGEDLDTNWTPWENADDAGSVIVVSGSISGLVNDGNYSIDRRNDGAPGNAEEGDKFGFSLMAGDFDGDGISDLAIASLDDSDGKGAGSVNVHYGNNGDLRNSSPDRWETRRSDMPSGIEAGDQFGRYLNVGNFNGDVNPNTGLPVDDLLVSGNLISHHFMPGQSNGLQPTEFLAQVFGDTPLDDYGALNPFFSQMFVVSVGDFNGDGRSEMVGFNPLLPEGVRGGMQLSGDIAGRLTILEMPDSGQLGYGNVYRRTIYGPGGLSGVTTGTITDSTVGGSSGVSGGRSTVTAYTPNGYEEVALDNSADSTGSEADEPARVSGRSFLDWQRNYGTASGATAAEGDFSGDGDVDDADLKRLLQGYGEPESNDDAQVHDYWQSSDGTIYDLFDMYGTPVIPSDDVGPTVPTIPTAPTTPTDPTTTESPTEPTNPTIPTTPTTGTTTQTSTGSTSGTGTVGPTTSTSPTATSTTPNLAPLAAAPLWFVELDDADDEESEFTALDEALASYLSTSFAN